MSISSNSPPPCSEAKGSGSLPSLRGREARMTKQLCACVKKQKGWLSFSSGSRGSAGMRVNALIRKSKEEIRTCCRNYICYETICSTREITKGAAAHLSRRPLSQTLISKKKKNLKPGILAHLFNVCSAANLIRFPLF